MKTLILIPARSGSKGIKNKNLLKINNTPLIEYTFKLANKLNKYGDIILSTDSKKIIKLSKKFKNIKSPFLRPKKISKDNSLMKDVALHTINFMKKQNKEYDYLLLLQPTTPFRKLKEVKEIIKFVYKNKIKSLFSICKSWQHPNEFINIKKNKITYLSNKHNNNRQKFKKFYFINGAVYMNSIEYFNIKKKFITTDSSTFLMSDETIIDIDEKFHLKVADSFAKKFNL